VLTASQTFKVISTSIIEIWLAPSRDGRTLSGASGTGNRAARFGANR
jgi:hypothetical protein